MTGECGDAARVRMIVKGYSNGAAFDLEVEEIRPGRYLSIPAAHAFRAMDEAAKAAGIDLDVNTAWRSHEEQTRMFNVRTAKMEAAQRKGIELSLPLVAKPGKSNHQSGIAVDINRAPGDNPATVAPDSPTDLWLNANAATFGFKRTVKSEPWHWEHVA